MTGEVLPSPVTQNRTTMSCSNTLTTLAPSCEALKQKSGFDKRFFIGSIADLTAVTFGTDQEVTAFTFSSGPPATGFKTYSGKQLKHNANASVEAGENFNARVQNFIAVLYAKSAAERTSIEELIDAEDVFVVAESNAGTLEVFGINKGANSQFDNHGMRCTALEKNYGALLNDDNAFLVTLTAPQMENLPLIYNETDPLATNLAALIAQVV
jgi:hypothetical protein